MTQYKKSDLTEWKSPDTKPTLPGVYQVKDWHEDVLWYYWNGEEWAVPSYQFDMALMYGNPTDFCVSPVQHKTWRGLKRAHKGK